MTENEEMTTGFAARAGSGDTKTLTIIHLAEKHFQLKTAKFTFVKCFQLRMSRILFALLVGGYLRVTWWALGQ